MSYNTGEFKDDLGNNLYVEYSFNRIYIKKDTEIKAVIRLTIPEAKKLISALKDACKYKKGKVK
jgi:hypothetical protein